MYIYVAPGNATDQLISQSTFKMRPGQNIGSPMIQNGSIQSDPNRECMHAYFYYVFNYHLITKGGLI